MHHPPASLLVFVAIAVAVAALGACERPIPGAPELDEWSCELELVVPVPGNREIDLVFVIDESPAMAGEQAALAANLRRFGEVLQGIAGSAPDVHVAIVSADRAHGGAFQAASGCGLRDLPFLIDERRAGGTRVRNYDGDLADVLTCLGSLGAAGGATSAPLGALVAALDGSNPGNAGFLRQDAFLVVVVVAAQDDCSGPAAPGDPFDCTTQGVRCAGQSPSLPGTYTDCVAASGPEVHDVDRHVAFLRGLKADPNLVMGGVVAGPREPFVVTAGPQLASSCDQGSASTARPAVRLADFAGRLGGGYRVASMCGEDWTDALGGAEYRQTLGGRCLGPVAATDLEPGEPGLQLECSVTEVSDAGAGPETETVVPRCQMLDDDTPAPEGARPCWWVTHDPVACASPWSQLSPRVERAAFPPVGTYELWRCVAAGCE